MSISMSYGGESFGGSIGVSAETSQGFGLLLMWIKAEIQN